MLDDPLHKRDAKKIKINKLKEIRHFTLKLRKQERTVFVLLLRKKVLSGEESQIL